MIDKNFPKYRPVKPELRYGKYYKDVVNVTDKGQEMAYEFFLTSVTSLDLSANILSGDIPVEIGDLRGQQTLNLSHNHLLRNIAEEIGRMVNLESLDMSCNQL